MKLADIVARIQFVIAADEAAGARVSERKVSLLATDSTDTIRNWRRAVGAGKDGGATLAKISAVADALGVNLLWLLADVGPMRGELTDPDVITQQILARIDQLTDEEKGYLLASADGMIARRHAEET